MHHIFNLAYMFGDVGNLNECVYSLDVGFPKCLFKSGKCLSQFQKG